MSPTASCCAAPSGSRWASACSASSRAIASRAVSNRPELLIAAVATWERGGTHVCADHGASLRDLETILERTGARALVYEPPHAAEDPLAVVRALRATRPELLV